MDENEMERQLIEHEKILIEHEMAKMKAAAAQQAMVSQPRQMSSWGQQAPPMNAWAKQMNMAGGISGMKEEILDYPTARDLAEKMLSLGSVEHVRTALLVQAFEELNTRQSAARRVSDKFLASHGRQYRPTAVEVLEALNLIVGLRELPTHDSEMKRIRL